MAGTHAANIAKKPRTVRALMFTVTPDAADFWFGISNLALIIGVIVVAIATFGSITLSGAREHFANERIAANEAETARANESAAMATLEQEKLRQQLAWRRLDAKQTAVIVAGLRGINFPITLQIVLSDPEAARFGVDVRAALTSAGVNFDTTSVILTNNNGPVTGVLATGSLPDITRLAQPFLDAGIAVVGEIVPNASAKLSIASKPAPTEE